MNKVNGIYGQEYFDRYAALATTPLGLAIYTSRWALITRYCPSPTVNGYLNVLDYGSGPGSFNAHGPDSYNKFNFDINPVCGFTDKPTEKVDILTLWDSLEHIPDFYGEVKKVNAEWLFITTPNILSVYDAVETWKHTRLGEHIHHFEPKGLEVIFDDMGYQLVETNYDEGRLRDPKKPNAIVTMVFKKRA